MYKLTEGAVLVAAEGTRQTIEQVDMTFETGLRAMADVVAGLRGSGVPAGRIQHVHDSMVESLDNCRSLRKSIVKMVGHLQAIQLRSDQAEVAAGCPTPWHELFTTAELKTDTSATKVDAA